MSVASEDYYEALGVPRDASAEDIRRAYRALARQVPPGHQQGAGRRGPLQGDLGGVRGAARSGEAGALRPLRRPGRPRPRAGAGSGGFSGFDGGDDFGGVSFDVGGGDFSDLFDQLFSRGGASPRQSV